MAPNRNGRPVRIAQMNIRATPAVETNVDPGNHDTGAAAVFDTAANEFGKMAQRVGKLADQAAALEGADAGAQAGLDLEFRPTKSLSIRGRAFDKAGIPIAFRRMRMGLNADMQAALKKYGDDPGKLAAALATRQKGWIKQAARLSPQLAARLTLSARQSQLGLVRQATRARLAKTVAAERNSADADIADRLKTIERNAYNGGLDEQATASLASEKTDLTAAVQAVGVNGKPLFSPRAQQRFLKGLDQRVATARIRGAFERTTGLDGKEKFVETLREDWKKGRGVSRHYDLNGMERMVRSLEADLVPLRLEHRKNVTHAARQMKGMVDMALKGYALPKEQVIDQFEHQVTKLDSPELEAGWESAKNTLSFVSDARRSSPYELGLYNSHLQDQIREKGATPERVARLELGREIQQNMERSLSKNPYEWVERTGLATVDPIHLNDPASMQNRVALNESLRQHFRRDIPLLRASEKQAIMSVIGQGPDEMLVVTHGIVSGFGEKTGSVLSEIARDAPGLAALGALTHRKMPSYLLRKAASGLALIRAGRGKKGGFVSRMEGSGALKKIVLDETGDAFQMLPQAEKGLAELAWGIAEMDARNAGTQVTTEIMTQAVQQAAGQREINGHLYGGITKFNGQHVLVPDHIRQDRFDDAIGQITQKNLDAWGVGKGLNGDRFTPAHLRNARLVSVGVGRYLVAMGDPDTGHPQYVRGPGGPNGAWVLDLSKFTPREVSWGEYAGKMLEDRAAAMVAPLSMVYDFARDEVSDK